MSKLVWDQVGERFFETGVNKCAVYPQSTDGTYPLGVAWNGVSNVTESPEGAEASPIFANNIKYLNLVSNEDMNGSIEAYTYPDEFSVCLGEASPVKGLKIAQQSRTPFGLVYQTRVGNDTTGVDFGYKLHLLYNAVAGVSERAYNTINESIEPEPFSWDYTTTPVELEGYKPTALLTLDSTLIAPEKLTALEAILYGTEDAEARLPLPAEVIEIIGGATEDVAG